MKKTLLITWWTWYIGSHAVVAFEEAGYKTVIVDNLSNSTIQSLTGIEKIIWYKPDFHELDLRDSQALETVFQQYDFDGVIHFAWLKAVWESCEKATEYFDNNIVWSLRLFECMEKHAVKNIVFSSSATVYDPANFWKGWGVWESASSGETTNPYGTTKYVLERMLIDLSKFSGFQVINLRYFNPIGAHKSSFIWEYPDQYPNNLLPYIMKVACGELEYLNVFWDNYDTIDGTWVRDYIDVCDLIDGHLKAYESLEKYPEQEKEEKWYFESYNLWVWSWVSVLELIQICEEVSGKKIQYKITSRRSGDIGEVYCDPGKALRDLAWKAKTSIRESVENSYNFNINSLWWNR